MEPYNGSPKKDTRQKNKMLLSILYKLKIVNLNVILIELQNISSLKCIEQTFICFKFARINKSLRLQIIAVHYLELLN